MGNQPSNSNSDHLVEGVGGGVRVDDNWSHFDRFMQEMFGGGVNQATANDQGPRRDESADAERSPTVTLHELNLNLDPSTQAVVRVVFRSTFAALGLTPNYPDSVALSMYARERGGLPLTRFMNRALTQDRNRDLRLTTYGAEAPIINGERSVPSEVASRDRKLLEAGCMPILTPNMGESIVCCRACGQLVAPIGPFGLYVPPRSAVAARHALIDGLKDVIPGSDKWKRSLSQLSRVLLISSREAEIAIFEEIDRGDVCRRPTSLDRRWLYGSYTVADTEAKGRAAILAGCRNRHGTSADALPREADFAVGLWASAAVMETSRSAQPRQAYHELGEADQCSWIWAKLFKGVHGDELRTPAMRIKIARFIAVEHFLGNSHGEQWAAYVLGYNLHPWKGLGKTWRDRNALVL
jgi:hypothetical protein